MVSNDDLFIRTSDYPTLHTETVELIQFAVQQRISNGLWRARVRGFEDTVTDQLVLALEAYVYGRRGDTVSDTKRVSVAKFPRYIPKWLQRRWTRVRELRLDVTPMIVWPDATFAPPERFGGPIRIVSTSSSDRTTDRWK